ncbi:MAG: hypothetical protein V4565_10380 [Bacteroidota bacterium]
MIIKTVITALLVFGIFNAVNSQVTLDIKERPKPVPTFNFRKISANNDAIFNLGIDDKGPKSVYYIEKYNAETLALEYQKDLKICADDKSALVHPLFVPPVCFESNNQLLAFYCGYNEDDKKVSVNAKTTNAQGDVNSKYTTLISSKDIEVALEGMYWNFIGFNKPVVSYYLSEDKKTIVIEIDSPKFKKIYSYTLSDLLAGKTEHKEFDIKAITETEKIVISKCFFINNVICFAYTKKLSPKSSDFGMAVLDSKTNTFQFKNLGLNVNEMFSLDFLANQSANKIFVTGYLRYPINASKAVSIENSKVKPFNVHFNFTTMAFADKNEFDFVPSVAKFLSIPKTAYGFIDKEHTPDQYLENTELIESPNFYYSISNLLFGRGPSPTALVPQVGGPAMAGGGVTTVSRDILITKFDKTGKLISQYLLPRHTGFNTFAGSRSGQIFAFGNRQRNFNYGLKGDELHFFYLDNKKNVFDQSVEYDPRNTAKCVVDNGALIHMSIKNDKIVREVLQEKDHKCYFYSGQSLMVKNAVILDVESGKKDSELGRVIIN